MNDSTEPGPVERAASALGRNPAEIAGLDRLGAAARECGMSRFRLGLAAHEATGAMRNFADAWERSEQAIAAAEADQIAAHPDLAELNVALDGFYS